MRQKRQSGGGNLMMWGVLMPNGLIALKQLEGKQDSVKYINLLQTFAVPLLNLNMDINYNFVQDNCPIHVSRKSKQYLQNQRFQVVEWPAKSPDINLMENIWKMISDIVYEGKQPENLKQLGRKIVEAVWIINTQKLEITKGLYSTFRRRLTKILISKGNICNN